MRVGRLEERGRDMTGEEERKSRRGEDKRNSPQPPVHGSCTTRDDLGDENSWVIRNVGIVYSTGNAEAQARVPLHTGANAFLWR